MNEAQRLAALVIRQFEGCRLTAYQDAIGVWTIGWGETEGVHQGLTWTQEQADAALNYRLASLDQIVIRESIGANPGQRAALISFAYNLGVGAMRQLLSHHKEEAEQFSRWVHAGGQVLQGLVKRRAVEEFLFRHGDVLAYSGR